MKRQKPGVSNDNPRYLFLIVLLRVLIGWHFLYEGLSKIFMGTWTPAPFLQNSRWLLADVFHAIAANPDLLKIVDLLNMWGLTLIGLALLLGLFTRLASISGIFLLALYYIANPPLIGISYGMQTEGNYLIVDKNLVELLALCVLALFPAGKFWGLDGLLWLRKNKGARSERSEKEHPERDKEAQPLADTLLNRREILKPLVSLPFFGAFIFSFLKKQSWESFEEKHLLAATTGKPEAITSATIKTFRFASLKDLKGQLPYGRIGNLKISRLFLGGNLIGGWAHARDLIYVSKLVKAYHTDQKVFDTFRLAEKCGINTILTNPALCRVINEYWRKEKGRRW